MWGLKRQPRGKVSPTTDHGGQLPNLRGVKRRIMQMDPRGLRVDTTRQALVGKDSSSSSSSASREWDTGGLACSVCAGVCYVGKGRLTPAACKQVH
jgi:hypothetical protein